VERREGGGGEEVVKEKRKKSEGEKKSSRDVSQSLFISFLSSHQSPLPHLLLFPN
jgi:hypothetical protein